MLLALLLAAASLPDFAGYVVDRAGLLDAGSVAHLKQVASQLDHAGVAQVAVCTVPESAMDDDSLEDYAVALFKKWGLGHGTKRDDGVLVLFVPGKPGHRQIRIEVGYGLEGVLPDGKVGQIRTQQAFPYMRNDDYSGAAVHVVDAIASVLQADAAAGGDTAPVAGSPRRGTYQGLRGAGPANTGGLVITVLCMFALVIALATSAGRRQFPGRKTQLAAAGLTGGSVVALVVAGSSAGWLALVVGLILVAVIWVSIRSHRCPKDGSWMTIDEEVIDRPTYWSEGVAHVVQQCTNRKCGYRREFDKAIPRKQMTTVVSGGGGGGGGGGGDGFSGGGGGRSGGGGASGSV